MNYNLLLWAYLITLVIALFPAVVFGECTCEPDGGEINDRNKSLALRYKLAAFVSILAGGAAGVCLPVLRTTAAALRPDRDLFSVVKAFAGGVILSTGFVHVLPDAFESLTSPCLGETRPWGEFPMTGFVAMAAAAGTMLVEACATSYYRRREGWAAVEEEGEEVGMVPVHTHGHSHKSVTLGVESCGEEGETETELLRHRVVSQVLELGIVVHSVIIGIALGASQSPKTIRPLIAALTFHQFFEGIGLGGCITQAKFNARAVAIMVAFFSLTTPIGIAIGIGIANVYSETSSTALIVQGVFNSASAGILIYMALVDLLSADFMSDKIQRNSKLQLEAAIALLLGAFCMSLLANWA